MSAARINPTETVRAEGADTRAGALAKTRSGKMVSDSDLGIGGSRCFGSRDKLRQDYEKLPEVSLTPFSRPGFFNLFSLPCLVFSQSAHSRPVARLFCPLSVFHLAGDHQQSQVTLSTRVAMPSGRPLCSKWQRRRGGNISIDTGVGTGCENTEGIHSRMCTRPTTATTCGSARVRSYAPHPSLRRHSGCFYRCRWSYKVRRRC
jgi:hypothetical protein